MHRLWLWWFNLSHKGGQQAATRTLLMCRFTYCIWDGHIGLLRSSSHLAWQGFSKYSFGSWLTVPGLCNTTRHCNIKSRLLVNNKRTKCPHADNNEEILWQAGHFTSAMLSHYKHCISVWLHMHAPYVASVCSNTRLSVHTVRVCPRCLAQRVSFSIS